MDENNDQPQPDTLTLKIKTVLLQQYEPIQDYAPGAILMSTLDIYNELQRFYPSTNYDMNDVANWLNEGGFVFKDMGNLRFEWLIMPV